MPCKRASCSAAGFTLLELTVVLALLALMVGLAMPRLGGLMSRAAVAGTTAEIGAALRTAGSAAISEGRVAVFRGDAASGGYWIDRRHYRLAAADAQQPVTVSGRVSFYPWGGSSGGSVWIETPAARREISVDAVTGRAVLAP